MDEQFKQFQYAVNKWLIIASLANTVAIVINAIHIWMK